MITNVEPPEEFLEQFKIRHELEASRNRLHDILAKESGERDRSKTLAELGELDKSVQELSARLPSPPRPSESFPAFGPWPPDMAPETPWPPSPPYGVPVPVERYDSICNLNESRSIQNAVYFENESGGGEASQHADPKRAFGLVGAGPSPGTSPGAHSVVFGFTSTIPIPGAQGDTTVNITSMANAVIPWAEANTFGGQLALVKSTIELSVSVDNQLIAAVPRTVLDFANTIPDTVLHESGRHVGLGQILDVVVPPGNDREITVFESAFMIAVTTDGHCYLSIGFTWDPLSVKLREGCRAIRVPGWGYWGDAPGR